MMIAEMVDDSLRFDLFHHGAIIAFHFSGKDGAILYKKHRMLHGQMTTEYNTNPLLRAEVMTAILGTHRYKI